MVRKRPNLTTVAPLLIGLILTLVFSAVSIIGLWGSNRIIQRSLVNNGRETLSTSTRLLFNSLDRLDVSTLNTVANQLLSQESIVYVVIRDDDGRTIIEAIDERVQDDQVVRNYIIQSGTQQDSVQQADLVEYEFGQYLSLEGSIAAGSTSIGTLEIVFDEEPQRAALLSVLRPIAFAILALFIGVTLVVFVLTLYATRPLQELVAVAKGIGDGNLDTPVPIRGLEEIAVLGTALEQMRIELKHLKNTLEQQVEERTKQLQARSMDLAKSNRELTAARKQADEASRLKSEFLAIMSHELRTPLNAVIGFTGILLLDKDAGERTRHMIKRIRANGERLLSLLDDILDISRIEADRLELIPSMVSLRELTSAIQGDLGVVAQQKGLEFSVHVGHDVPTMIFIDEDAITKVLTNLLSNAFKFTEEGRVLLNIRLQDHDFVFEVRDTGQGIPAHMQEVIFETFRQVDSSNTRAHGGAGLGLSIVRHLCTAMNGVVDVKSALGEGSTFTVKLPLVQPVNKVEKRETDGILNS